MEILLIDSTWAPPEGEYRSKIVLNYDNWNDYNYRTSFGMYYCDDECNVHQIGFLKIYYYENDEARTNNYSEHTRASLGKSINQLGRLYCSLGQELSYYKNLKKFLPDEYLNILKRLNDIAVFDDIKRRFINENGVKSSLLRFSSAEKALNEAKSIVNNQQSVNKDISFSYNTTVPYDDTPVTLNFDFHQNENVPYRINILIGKNGTGKTQILSHLANSLSGFTDNQETGCFVRLSLIHI